MRKALVNDIVHSFCWAIRTRKSDASSWPVLILGRLHPEFTENTLEPEALVSFAAFAYAIQRNYVIANRHLIFMAAWLRSFDAAERIYAAQLMEKYYHVSSRHTQQDQYQNRTELVS